MAFADYEQLAEPLALPYRGKVYVLPEIGIQDTIRLYLVLDPESDEDMTVEELENLLLGDALEQMRADNVPQAMVDRAFRTATAEFRYGREIAEQVWNLKGDAADPKAPSPSAAASTPSTSTGEANETPSPASTTGTKTSRRKQGPSATTTPPASPGRRSSARGTRSSTRSSSASGSTSTTSSEPDGSPAAGS